jgi:glyoxylase-like metal-dependent hydrolase (beta-lactamase superfamily II)
MVDRLSGEMRLVLLITLLVWTAAAQKSQLPAGLHFISGPVNGLVVKEKFAVYGDPGQRLKKASHVLLTHARRDVVWAARSLATNGSIVVAPESERALLTDPQAFWVDYESTRFHDYSQVNTKVLRGPIPVSKFVRDGDRLSIEGVQIEVIDTRGYTRGAVSYMFEIAGKRIACTGDLIYGDGKLFDISSLQDAIPEAKTRGYHGYAARAGDVIGSLRKIAARKPDILVPARGPIITEPGAAIERLISRLQWLMASHFSTDALRWYWGEDSLRIRSRQALDGKPVDSMPMAGQRPLPEWVRAIGNSRLIISQTGAAFLIDAGYKGLQSEFDKLTAAKSVKRVDGIWITHYHDDHTDYAQALSNRFGCPVHFTESMKDLLERPSNYRLPCLTATPITSGKPEPDGRQLRWQEFKLTFFDFPGQTLYHGGLLVEKDGDEALFFVGDSFTPSGIDDYCLQNRDFVRENAGYLRCLNILEKLPNNVWLINQHVQPTFRFSSSHFARMRAELRKRIAVLAELSPWPDPNYAVDESWAVVYPYGNKVKKGERVRLEVRITNHSPKAETYRIAWNLPRGWKIINADRTLLIPARGVAAAGAVLTTGLPGLHVVTADIAFGGRDLKEWTEALVRIEPE